jgi:hypothetical protein
MAGAASVGPSDTAPRRQILLVSAGRVCFDGGRSENKRISAMKRRVQDRIRAAIRLAASRTPLARTQLESVYSSKTILQQTPDRDARAQRTEEGEFFVTGLISSNGPDRYYYLSADCEHCHYEIKITVQAPRDVKPSRYTLDEARRLALIQHLRTEHKPKHKPTPKAETGSD